jgi:hypothetical protein
VPVYFADGSALVIAYVAEAGPAWVRSLLTSVDIGDVYICAITPTPARLDSEAGGHSEPLPAVDPCCQRRAQSLARCTVVGGARSAPGSLDAVPLTRLPQ